jgi:hypothetical protein
MNAEENFEIWFTLKTPLNTFLFADDQIIIQEKEDKLQRALHKLEIINKIYNLKISTQKKR